MKKNLRRGDKRGASILLLSFFFLTVLFLLAASLYKIVPAEMHAASRSHQDLRGHYVARAGIQEAINWLGFQMETFDKTNNEQDLPDYTTGGRVFPNIVAFETATNAKRPFAKGDWRYEVDIEPHQDNLGLTNNSQVRLYSVTSVAFLNNKPIKRIDVMLRQKTFALYGLFIDRLDPRSEIAVTGDIGVDGPAHTNDYWRFRVMPGVYANPNADPYFTASVGYSSNFSGVSANAGGDGSEWLGTSGSGYDENNAPYAPGNSTAEIDSRYEKVFEGGKSDLRSKDSIELPSSTLSIAQDAWPDSSTLPTSRGIHVSINSSDVVQGGVYINGEVKELELALDKNGNQVNYFKQDRANDTRENNVYGYRSYSPPRYYEERYCAQWGSAGGSGGSGVSGGSASVCVRYATRTRESRERYLIRTETVTDWDEFRTRVVEVTEAPFEYKDVDGNDQVAPIGSTVILEEVYDNETNTATPLIAKHVTGQINGTSFSNDNIGRESNTWAGVWGIAKGSVLTDTNGQPVLDSNGKYQYNNKTIATSLNDSISIGGDLLQFDPTRFENLVKNGSLEPTNHSRRAQIALDPSNNELSPNNDHVLGLVSRDVWMKGPKNSHSRNNNDGYNDVYAIILAGKTELDSSGNPIINSTTGRPEVSGGFGTWRAERDRTGDGLGKYRVFGGIIQGTTGANYRDSSSDTHFWTSSAGGSNYVGYEVETRYDVEATRQRIFPAINEFAIMRYLERSARQ